MKSQVIEVGPRKSMISKSSWPTKKLADVHLEAILFCEFGCRYCSSNSGLHLRFLKKSILKAVEAALGKRFEPHNAAHIVIAYREVVAALENELNRRRKKPGTGKTLVYSQLTDGFSPVLLKTATTRRILELLLEKTNYRIRILTKNAIVGRPEWVKFFAQYRERLVVGLSIGTLDERFAARMEGRTSRPQSRISALQTLQDAGVPTFGMLCPVFPQVLETDELERLIDAIRPDHCEHVWAETFNDRSNWRSVRDAYPQGSETWNWLTRVFGQRETALWSRYATDLYCRIHDQAVQGNWTDKLRYLLYEKDIAAEDAVSFQELNGVLLQCKKGKDGRSKNPAFSSLASS
jgi:DNA repair photolyase